MRVTNSYWIYPSVIFVCSLAYLVGGWLFLLGGRAFGCYLIKKASKRRKALLANAKLEENHGIINLRSSARSDDEDWEKVDSEVSRIGIHGEKTDDDWEGIIGFLHPFW